MYIQGRKELLPVIFGDYTPQRKCPLWKEEMRIIFNIKKSWMSSKKKKNLSHRHWCASVFLQCNLLSVLFSYWILTAAWEVSREQPATWEKAVSVGLDLGCLGLWDALRTSADLCFQLWAFSLLWAFLQFPKGQDSEADTNASFSLLAHSFAGFSGFRNIISSFSSVKCLGLWVHWKC